MAMGTGKRVQVPLFLTADDLPEVPTTPFFEELSEVLDQAGFDDFVERVCSRFYNQALGRPSLAPGVYFRMLLLGCLVGFESERRIALQAADSLSLRQFLGYGPHEATPDRSTLSKTRKRIALEAHAEVFGWVLGQLREAGLSSGAEVAVDATTLEANAALKGLVRRETGEAYREFVCGLAEAAGERIKSEGDLIRFDRKRKGKSLSNEEWESPDARVAKMKDGTIHLAYKAEHAVDLESGALVGVTVQGADSGDTQTLAAVEEAHGQGPATVVLDKGVSQRRDAGAAGADAYVAVPEGPERNWKGKDEEQRRYAENEERSGQGVVEAAAGEGGALDGTHVRDGGAAAAVAAGPGQREEAGANPRLRAQSRSADAEPARTGPTATICALPGPESGDFAASGPISGLCSAIGHDLSKIC